MKSKDQAGVFESLLDDHAKGKKKTVLKHIQAKHTYRLTLGNNRVDSLELVTRTEVKGIE